MTVKQSPFLNAAIAWEEPPNNNDIYSYLNPIIVNSRVLACCPYDNKMRSSSPRIVLIAVLMCVMCGTGCVYGYREWGMPYSTDANAVVYMAIVALSIFTTALIVFLTLYQRKKLIIAMDKIRSLDSKLLKMGVLYKYDKKEIYAELFLRCFFKLCMVIFDWIAYKQSFDRISGPTILTSLYYSYFVIYNCQHIYTALMSVVYKHFSLISQSAKAHRYNEDVIHRFLEIHFELCEICAVITDWFSPQLLFITSHVFLATTLNINALVMAMISFLDPLPPQITIFISCTFWVVARLYEMWEISDACTKTEIKAEKLGKDLSNLIIDDKMANDNELLELHFHIQPKLKITASGFFKINNSLFQSMLAYATTYVVIIIQVQPQMQGILCSDATASPNSSSTKF